METYYYTHYCVTGANCSIKINVSMALHEATSSGVANNSS